MLYPQVDEYTGQWQIALSLRVYQLTGYTITTDEAIELSTLLTDSTITTLDAQNKAIKEYIKFIHPEYVPT
jgi:oligoribonuclease (3'-5' exoribonuclease)